LIGNLVEAREAKGLAQAQLAKPQRLCDRR
jgi:ribosome-binding protein aMBF1 (putative translation factor)